MLAAVVMLNEMQKRGLVKEVDKGMWMRIPINEQNNSNSM